MNYYIVSNDEKKNKVVEFLSEELFYETKIMDYSTFLKKFYFKITKQMVYKVSCRFNVNIKIVEMYLKQLYYIDDNDYGNDNAKLQFLLEIKKYLSDNGLLIDSSAFHQHLLNKKIVFSAQIKQDGLFQKLIKDLSQVTEIEVELLQPKYEVEVVHEYQTIEEEVIGVISSIVELLKQGIDINHLYLANLDNTYRLLFDKYFKVYGVPCLLEPQSSIYGTRLVQVFLQLYESDIEVTIEKLKKIVKNPMEEEILLIIVQVCNQYRFIDDYLLVKDCIVEDFKDKYVPKKNYENVVREIRLSRASHDDDYVFLVSCNQGSVPSIHKDENYLTDNEFALLGLPLVKDLNQLEKQFTMACIRSWKHISLSYKLRDFKEEYYPSNMLEELSCEIIKSQPISYQHSKLMNQFLLTKKLDQYFKFGEKASDLALLYGNYDVGYKKYKNEFSGINKDLFMEHQKEFHLSFTKIDSYFHCPFQYYLKYILKLDEFEDSFMLKVGSIYHAVLESVYEEFDFDFKWNEVVSEYEIKEAKELFFLSILKEKLKSIIEILRSQAELTNLNQLKSEEKVIIPFAKNITFSGIIDKILYDEDLKMLAVIDYKTGGLHYQLNHLKYGLDMQLPIYLYLLKHSNFKDYRVTGFYMQRLLHPVPKNDQVHTIDEMMKKQLLLHGYSNMQIDVLKEWDSSYSDSKMIQGMKLKKDGFYAYSKVLSDTQINSVITFAEQKMKEAIQGITNAEFKIRPKKIGDQLVGCDYCPYGSICNKSDKDYELLEEVKDLEFLGGE